jgi:F-type H+-transporting ATPase subunit a
MIRLAIENPPVFHPAVKFCDNVLLCEFNYDSLISTAVSIAITLAFGFWVASRLQSRTPGKFQMVFELLIDYTRTLIKDTVGEDAMFILPLALTLFFYILVANWIDFLPLPHPLAPANTDFNQTLAMAMVVFIATQAYSLRLRGFAGYFRHFMRPEGVAKPIQIAFIPLNIIEEIVKPVTLSLRLMGNIFGGVVMLWVLTALLTAVPIPAVPYGLSAILVVIWKLFDVFFVGTLQAFIFFLLTIIYFGQAREGHGEEHEAGHAAGASPAVSHST